MRLETALGLVLALGAAAAPLSAQDMNAYLSSGLQKYHHSDFSGAAEDFKAGLALAEMLGSKEGLAAFNFAFGNLYSEMEDYSRAIEHYSRAVELDREVGDRGSEADTLSAMGLSYGSLGDYPKALEIYVQALKTHQELGDKAGEAADLANRAVAYIRLGDFFKAIEDDQRALKVYQELGAKEKQANLLSDLALGYGGLGDMSKALEYDMKALDIRREIGDKSGERTSLNNLGITYADSEDYPKALEYETRALQLDRELGIPTTIQDQNIGDIKLAQGKLDEAFALFSKNDDPIRTARYYLLAGKPKRAAADYEKAAQDGKRLGMAKPIGAANIGLGLAQESLGDFAKARAAFQAAIDSIERQRELLPPSARGRFFSAKVYGYSRLEAYQGRCRTAADPDDAFYWAESAKARVFIEALAAHADKAAGLPSDLAKTEAEAAARISSLYQQEDAAFRRKDRARLEALADELAAARKDLDALVADLRGKFPAYAAAKYPQPLKPSQVALRPGEVLLEYEVTGPKTLLFVMAPGKPVRRLEIAASRERLKALVARFRAFFENAGSAADLAAFDGKTGKSLYDLLLRDALAGVPAQARVIIVPDDFLGALPFEALPASVPAKEALGRGDHGPFPLGLSYFGDAFRVSYAQSATALTLLRSLPEPQAKPAGAVGVCDPVFSASDRRAQPGAGDESRRELREALSQWRTMGVAGVKARGAASVGQDADSPFPRLAKTRLICAQLPRLFGERASSVLSGVNAVEEAVLKIPFDKYKFAVLATHGILSGDIPYIREPALVLSQVGNAEGYQGFLTMSQVMDLRMPVQVVALPACQTGLGASVSGEGVMGMGRAFQYAGAKNVVMSLYSIAEDASVALTNSMLEQLSRGAAAGEALRSARADIRRQGYENPFYWAAFVLMAD